MIIIIALFAFLLIFIGNTPARTYERQAKEDYEKYRENTHKRNQEYAKEHDYYYERNNLFNLEVNPNYYGDGSLRRDPNTGKTYEKGKYYVDSRGQTANWKQDSSKQKPD